MEGTPQRCGEGLLVNSCFAAVLCGGRVCVVCVVNAVCDEPAGFKSAKTRGVSTSLRLLVLVVGARRVGIGPVDGVAPSLDVAKLMAKRGHGQVRDLGVTDRALIGPLLVHRPNLPTTSSAFHGMSTNPFPTRLQRVEAPN